MRRIKLDTASRLLIVILILIIVGVTSAVFLLRSDPIDEALAGDRIVSLLLVVEQDGAPLSIHTSSFYPPSRRAVAFDVPSELGLILKKLGRVDRIDAVYNRADPAVFIDEVSGVLSLELPFFLAFDLSSLTAFVDLVEGLELFIAEAVNELEDGQRVLLPPGTAVLDGDKVAIYASYQLIDEDENAAILRRQRLTTAIFSKLAQQAEYLSSKGIDDFFYKQLRTNMTKSNFFKLLASLASIDIERMTFQRVSGNYRDVSGQRLLFPLYDGSLMRDIVKRSLAGLVRSGEGVDSERVYALEVLNGTTTVGLAQKTADLLEGFGYNIVAIGNADSNDYAQTLIIDRIDQPSAAQLLGDVIKCDKIQTEELRFDDLIGIDTGVDFKLILGKDFNGRYVVR